jgi:hypothetical protein
MRQKEESIMNKSRVIFATIAAVFIVYTFHLFCVRLGAAEEHGSTSLTILSDSKESKEGSQTAKANGVIKLPADAGVPGTPYGECIRWAAEELQTVLKEAEGPKPSGVTVIVTSRSWPGSRETSDKIPAEAFRLIIKDPDGTVNDTSHGAGDAEITGTDAVGAMYGIFELAEQLRQGRLENATQQPFLEFRADNPFAHWKPFLLNDVAMWKAYIDMLARNRFNVLDIHGGYDLATTEFPNLYPRLVTVPDYPDVGDKADQASNLADFKAILAHGKNRGVKVILMNYHAAAEGVPAEKLADYTAKAVATLLKECPDLKMLGFRIGESGQETNFFEEAYLKGAADSGRSDVRLYTRSWGTTREALEKIGKARGGEFDIEIKYNGEHLGLPYNCVTQQNSATGANYSYQGYIEGTNLPYDIIWQVRANGTHRFWSWGQSSLVRRAAGSFALGNARGFTLEPQIAYFDPLAETYYKAAEDQQVYKFIWQKHWMWYFLWGRLSYNPNLPEETLVAEFQRHFGASGRVIYEALQSSGWIVPLVFAYRYQGEDHRMYAPERETGCFIPGHADWKNAKEPLDVRAKEIGNKLDALSFAKHEPVDTQTFISIGDFVTKKLEDSSDGRIGPANVAHVLSNAAEKTRNAVAKVTSLSGRAADEWRLLKTDILCASYLGDFYANRILGTTHLLYACKSGSQTDYDKALQYLGESRQAWKKLAETADAVYGPLNDSLRKEPKYQWSVQIPLLEKLDATAVTLWNNRSSSTTTAKPLTFTATEQGGDIGIEVTELRHTIQNNEVTITCHIKADAGVRSAVLFHKKISMTYGWQSTPMTVNEETASITLPIDESGLLYYVQITNTKGLTGNFPNVFKSNPYRFINPSEVKPGSSSKPAKGHSEQTG